MKAAEIRERFLSFFEEREHRRVPSASLVPPSYDPTVLLTTAGMQPFKPYSMGLAEPPACGSPPARSASAPPTSRTWADRAPPHVLRDARQLLGRRLLQAGRRRVRVGAVHEGFGFDPERIWITVFGGDEELGLGPTRRRSGCWRASACPTSGSCASAARTTSGRRARPAPAARARSSTSTAGPEFGPDADRPGDDTERFLEFWNLVFMQYELHEDGSSPSCPSRTSTPAWASTGWRRSSRTSRRCTRPTLPPLIDLGEELSGRSTGRIADHPGAARARRHGRAASFLIADGVVPSNEERGYILRRIMRRAIQQGRVLGLEEAVPPGLCEVVVEGWATSTPSWWPSARRSRAGRRPRRRASAARWRRARSCSATDRARAKADGRLRGARRGRLPAARHLRLPVRDDPGDARRGGPDGRRRRASRS